MSTIKDFINKHEEDIKNIQIRIENTSTWVVKTEVKLNILFVVLTFLAITFGGLIITLIWEILTHKIVLGF